MTTNEKVSIIMKASHSFTNGVRIFNSTPHALNFRDVGTNATITIPSTVPAGEKTGIGVINAAPTEEVVDELRVRTVFKASESGKAVISLVKDVLGDNVIIIGSLAAANAYKDVLGMIPVPGFERVPPAEKLMRCDKFNVGDCW